MAIEHLLAAVHIKRRARFLMQRTQSGHLFASVIAKRLPAVLLKILQQRKSGLESVMFGRAHGGAVSTIRMRAAARKSQARRVGARRKANRRLSIRRHA